jgi:hypothetical protein
VFVSSSGYTPDAYKHFLQGQQPMVLCVIDTVDNGNSNNDSRLEEERPESQQRLTHFTLNAKARALLPHLLIATRHHKTAHSNAINNSDHTAGQKVLTLLYNGKEITNSLFTTNKQQSPSQQQIHKHDPPKQDVPPVWHEYEL